MAETLPVNQFLRFKLYFLTIFFPFDSWVQPPWSVQLKYNISWPTVPCCPWKLNFNTPRQSTVGTFVKKLLFLWESIESASIQIGKIRFGHNKGIMKLINFVLHSTRLLIQEVIHMPLHRASAASWPLERRSLQPIAKPRLLQDWGIVFSHPPHTKMPHFRMQSVGKWMLT